MLPEHESDPNFIKTCSCTFQSSQSIFGSIRSYFRGGGNSSADASRNAAVPFVPEEEEEERPSTELERALNKVKLETSARPPPATHPALRIRGVDTSGFGAGLEDESTPGDFSRPTTATDYKSRSAEVEQKLNSNLAELDSGLGRLKHLAHGLGKELDDQMELLDNLTDKTDLAEGTIVHQNSQIRRILKK